MIESIMITWCCKNGLTYVDYWVNRGGQIYFKAMKGRKEQYFHVWCWSPFRCQKRG